MAGFGRLRRFTACIARTRLGSHQHEPAWVTGAAAWRGAFTSVTPVPREMDAEPDLTQVLVSYAYTLGHPLACALTREETLFLISGLQLFLEVPKALRQKANGESPPVPRNKGWRGHAQPAPCHAAVPAACAKARRIGIEDQRAPAVEGKDSGRGPPRKPRSCKNFVHCGGERSQARFRIFKGSGTPPTGIRRETGFRSCRGGRIGGKGVVRQEASPGCLP